MALIDYNLFGKIDKVQTAIDRLKAFEPEEGYIVADSGGKDSTCIVALAKMAGVKHECVYNVTTVDPPELVRFLREKRPDTKFQFAHYKDGQTTTMWNLIPRKGIPPTRLMRYCCEKLKESTHKGRLVVTGVRWAESTNRKLNQGAVSIMGKGANQIPEVQASNFIPMHRGGWF
jgi:phosphoadenosine phosphosulfate reductase